MAYGDYSGPDKPNKGHEGGACNRGRCQAEPALYYNHGSHSWYCIDCKIDIGEDHVNKWGWDLNHRPHCGHAMFETREEIDTREATEAAKKAEEIANQPPQLEDLFLYGTKQNHPYKPNSNSLQKLLKKGRQRGLRV